MKRPEIGNPLLLDGTPLHEMTEDRLNKQLDDLESHVMEALVWCHRNKNDWPEWLGDAVKYYGQLVDESLRR